MMRATQVTDICARDDGPFSPFHHIISKLNTKTVSHTGTGDGSNGYMC